MKIKKKQIMRYAEKLEERIHKLEQRELLSKMMQDDEKDGIYQETFMRVNVCKIAIRVENEQEFNELINIMNARGWRKKVTISGNKNLYYNNMPDTKLVQFHDEYLFLNGIEWDKGRLGDYQIIDFKTLKAILS